MLGCLLVGPDERIGKLLGCDCWASPFAGGVTNLAVGADNCKPFWCGVCCDEVYDKFIGAAKPRIANLDWILSELLCNLRRAVRAVKDSRDLFASSGYPSQQFADVQPAGVSAFISQSMGEIISIHNYRHG